LRERTDHYRPTGDIRVMLPVLDQPVKICDVCNSI